MKNSLWLLAVLVFALACNQPDPGIGKPVVNDLYPFHDFTKTEYSESMIRSAANLAGLDSSFALSSRTAFIFQFEIERNKSYYVPGTDSLLQHAIEINGMEQLVDIHQGVTTYQAFVKTQDDLITNAVYFESDTAKLKLIEFSGEMPVDVLMKEGMNSYNAFGELFDIDLLNRNGNNLRDTTAQ